MSTVATALCQAATDLHRQGRLREAIAAYGRAVACDPECLTALNNRGVALSALGEAAAALTDFDAALALSPGFVEALYNRANALRALQRHAEAVADYDRAIALRPDYAEAFNNRGNALQALERPQEAVASYDRALALRPGYADAIENKAILQSEFGELEPARHALEALVRVEPRRARAHFHLVRLKRLTRDDPQLAVLERLGQERRSMGPSDAVDVSFALGKAYDDVGEHARAFSLFAEGNALKRAGFVYDEAAALARMRAIAAAFTPEAIAARRGCGDSTVAPIFILGMPRSGSTLIEQILSRHPDVVPHGEVDAFEEAAVEVVQAAGAGSSVPETCLRLPPAQLTAIGRRYMEKIGAESQSVKRTTDKKPSNFLFAGLIHLALPGARIIHSRRDPIDTCWSCFSQRFGDGGLPSAYDLGELGRYYRAYAALMEHWRRALPAEAMLTVDYEAVVADVEGQARRILAYCGLEWSEACLSFQEARRHVRTASAGQVNRPLYRSAVGRARSYEPFLGPLVAGLAGVAAE